VIIGGHGIHEISALNPLLTIEPSESKFSVTQPFDAAVVEMVPGFVAPAYVPIIDAAVLFPSYTISSSQQASVPKEVNVN
jgi:hypothetical protein